MILTDEARHQRLGWTALKALWPSLSEPLRFALHREASAALGAFERKNAAPAFQRLASSERLHPACVALGVLGPQARIDAFYFAIEKQVLPRLNALGVDGTRAWRERYLEHTPVPTVGASPLSSSRGSG
jgi:hypothetical protein